MVEATFYFFSKGIFTATFLYLHIRWHHERNRKTDLSKPNSPRNMLQHTSKSVIINV